ncbi:hypothetical protein [Pseudomonas sp. B392_1p]|uniref:hypothetical protein n=1 Tax=Pseudomonas sp. B392_1p TaxID=3457507 RepID=UPI003FD17240
MAASDKGVIVKYECDRCGEHHDHESEAEDCCRPDVHTVYICPVCEQDHETRAEAESCIVGHGDLPGDLPEHCPSCLRDADTAQLRVEIAVAGHCSTCNPIYTPEENLVIKYALEPKD